MRYPNENRCNDQGERLQTLPQEVKEGNGSFVVFGPDGKVATGKDINTIMIFDANGEQLQTLPLNVNEGRITSVSFGPEGKLAAGVASGPGVGGAKDNEGFISILDVENKQSLAPPLHVKEGYVTSVAFGPDGKVAAGFSGDEFITGGVVLFDTQAELLKSAPLEHSGGDMTCIALGPDGIIAAGYQRQSGDVLTGGVELFDRDGKRLWPERRHEIGEGAVNSIAFGPDGKIAASYRPYSGAGGVAIFDASGKRLQAPTLEVKEGHVHSVAYGPDGSFSVIYRAHSYLSYSDPGGVVLFDPRGERLRPTPLEVKEGYFRSVVYGPEGRIAARYDVPEVQGKPRTGGVVLFDLRGERLCPTPLEVEGYIESVAFGPDGRVAVGYDVHEVQGKPRAGGVVLFDPRGERLRPTPLEVEGHVESVAFGPDGRVAVAAETGVILFDVHGKRLRPVPLKKVGLRGNTLAFDPEGRLFATSDSGVVLLDADPASWLRKAGQTANRNLTHQEWTQYFPGSPYRRTIQSLPWPHDLPSEERTQAEKIEKEHPEGGDAT